MALALFLLEVNTANSLARQRVFRDRLRYRYTEFISRYSDTEFIIRYRINRGIIIQLHEKIVGSLLRYTIEYQPIPTLTQLAVSLQFLATGSFQTVTAIAHGISQSSVSRCIAAVSDSLCMHAN